MSDRTCGKRKGDRFWDWWMGRRSRTDQIRPLREKMQECLNGGLRLGWLINPQEQQVEIYRRDREVEIVQFPIGLSGGLVVR